LESFEKQMRELALEATVDSKLDKAGGRENGRHMLGANIEIRRMKGPWIKDDGPEFDGNFKEAVPRMGIRDYTQKGIGWEREGRPGRTEGGRGSLSRIGRKEIRAARGGRGKKLIASWSKGAKPVDDDKTNCASVKTRESKEEINRSDLLNGDEKKCSGGIRARG